MLSQIPESLDVDGDRVAYSVPDPQPDFPQAATVVVRQVSSGAILETFHSNRAVRAVALLGDSLAFIVGDVDTETLPGPFFYTFDLMLASLSDGSVISVGSAGQTVESGDQALYWDLDTDRYEPDVMTASPDSWTPAVLLPDAYNTEAGALAAGGVG